MQKLQYAAVAAAGRGGFDIGSMTAHERIRMVAAADVDATVFTELATKYDDFILRFEFKLTPGANNGLALRCPLEGKPHGKGFESQILDNTAKRYKNLNDSQYHGSLYKLVAAKRGFLKPVGEWNRQEVMMNENHVKITLNGEVILEDADISRFRRPGKGHLGFLGHGSTVHFRNIKIKQLTP